MLYAIPVCAPYTAIISYKYVQCHICNGYTLHIQYMSVYMIVQPSFRYRVKLVPGTNKRGKGKLLIGCLLK